MKHKDLIDLNLYDRKNCLKFLQYKTKYNIEKYDGRYPLNQLTAMTYRVRDAIISMLKLIPELEQELNTRIKHSKEELESYLYEDLSSLKQKLMAIKQIKDLEESPLMKPAHSLTILEDMPTKKLNDLKKRLTIIKEILELEQEKQIPQRHTKKELESMTQDNLTKIRSKLRRIKVVQIELALPETVTKAKEIIASELVEYKEPQDITFITEEEGYQMFGEDFEEYSTLELENIGYKIEAGYGSHINNKEQKLKSEIRDQLITFISQLDKKRNIEDLYFLSLEELREIYEQIATHLESLPTYEDIALSAKMGL